MAMASNFCSEEGATSTTSTLSSLENEDSSEEEISQFNRGVVIDRFEFHCQFSSAYARNNRSSGQKSLRCFPSCSERGHVAGGFCGRSLSVSITLGFGESDFDPLGILFVLEIHPTKANSKYISSEVFTKSTIMGNLRELGSENGGELFVGEINRISLGQNQAYFDVVFNAKLHSYDYSWKSNRWVGSQESHVVDILIFQESLLDHDVIEVVGHVKSPEFAILSCHKRPVKPLRERGDSSYYASDSFSTSKSGPRKRQKAVDINCDRNDGPPCASQNDSNSTAPGNDGNSENISKPQMIIENNKILDGDSPLSTMSSCDDSHLLMRSIVRQNSYLFDIQKRLFQLSNEEMVKNLYLNEDDSHKTISELSLFLLKNNIPLNLEVFRNNLEARETLSSPLPFSELLCSTSNSTDGNNNSDCNDMSSSGRATLFNNPIALPGKSVGCSSFPFSMLDYPDSVVGSLLSLSRSNSHPSSSSMESWQSENLPYSLDSLSNSCLSNSVPFEHNGCSRSSSFKDCCNRNITSCSNDVSSNTDTSSSSSSSTSSTSSSSLLYLSSSTSFGSDLIMLPLKSPCSSDLASVMVDGSHSVDGSNTQS